MLRHVVVWKLKDCFMKRIMLSLFAFAVFCIFSCLSFAKDENKVIVYYFHTTARCFSCHKIEQYTEAAIKECFAKELESGSIEYRVINIEEKENQHFIQEYKLYTKSVVLSLIKDGKETEFKNLEKVWQFLRNKDKFYKYIKEETEGLLVSLRGDDRV